MTDDPMRTWLTRLSLAAGIAFTAHAEYDLARTLGADPWIAAMLPVAIDAYVVAALRWFKAFDIFLSLALMGTAQIAAHLLDAKVMVVDIPMVVVVSLLVPVAIWRTHALARSEHKPPAAPVPVPVKVQRVPDPPETYPAIATPVPAVPEPVPAGVRLLPIVARPRNEIRSDIPVPVLAADTPRTRLEVRAEYVPDPVPEDDEPLTPAGIGLAAEHFKELLFLGNYPSIRAIKEGLGVGQKRAKELQDALKEAAEKLAQNGAGHE